MNPKKYIQNLLANAGKTMGDESVLMQFIPIVLVLIYMSYRERFTEISHTLLGKLVAILLIIYYTSIDYVFGTLCCVIVIAFYQMNEREGLAEDEMVDNGDVYMEEPVTSTPVAPISAVPAPITSTPVAPTSAAPTPVAPKSVTPAPKPVLPSTTTPVAPSTTTTPVAPSTTTTPVAPNTTTPVAPSTTTTAVGPIPAVPIPKPVTPTQAVPTPKPVTPAPTSITSKKYKGGYKIETTTFIKPDTIDAFTTARDTFIREKCQNGILMYKDFPVKTEMADHIYPEIKYNTKSRCNPCDKTCDYSIVEAKLNTETELYPRSSNSLFDLVKDIFYPKRGEWKEPEAMRNPIKA
jgi:hypothetical protein